MRKTMGAGQRQLLTQKIQHWSRTQQLVALSGAEAELNAAAKAGQEGIGIGNLLAEMESTYFIRLYGVSSANHGIITRQGTGKVKHLSARQLWLQERRSSRGVRHKKVPRLYNWSDVLTHHFTKAEAEHRFPRLGVICADFDSEDMRGGAGA